MTFYIRHKFKHQKPIVWKICLYLKWLVDLVKTEYHVYGAEAYYKVSCPETLARIFSTSVGGENKRFKV